MTQAISDLPAITHVVYAHGFRSSPQSFKAQFLARWLKLHHPDVQYLCPQLPASPQAASELLLNAVHTWPKATMAVMGSSLGGFYATWLGAVMQCKTVLLNPAVNPARDLVGYIGTQTAWHNPDEAVVFEPDYIDELTSLYVGLASHDVSALPDPTQLLNVVATGDEVLSWKEMVARYPFAQLHLIEGSDHGISDFEKHFPLVKAYLGL